MNPVIHRIRNGRGQILYMFVLYLAALILIVGLAVDLGFAYVTKANLAKAVDSACLAGMRSIDQGTVTAGGVAAAMFSANYGHSGRDANLVTPNIVWGTDASNNTTLDINATASINTFFIGLLTPWKTLTVSASGESTRVKLIMSLVLDWSGSMFTAPPSGSGGALNGNLTQAVDSFVSKFDDNNDRVAMAAFGSYAILEVPIEYQFTTPIENAVQNPSNLGRTFSDGGVTIGLQQIQSVAVNPGENVLRVIVFFTDGFANTFQSTFGSCGTLNLGQDDPFNSSCSPGQCFQFMNPSDGSGASCSATTFTSIGGTVGHDDGTEIIVSPGTQETISSGNQNVWNEGQLRVLATANTARSTNIVIYCIGLGNDPTTINQTLLMQIANSNDPSNPTFNSSQPVGEAVFAATAADLQSVFDQIASKILLRLTK